MSQGTLLTFFKKASPSASTGQKSNDQSNRKIGSASKAKHTVPRKPLKNVGANGSSPSQRANERFTAGRLVWSRMEGHPWWPSMLWPHQTTKKLLRGSVPRQECHVQFFGQPPTRGWVPVDFIKPFDEKSKDEFVCEEDGFAEALDDAVATIDLPVSDRGSLVVVIPSDEENSDMECLNRENVTPESAGESRKKGAAKDKRRKRAYIADDSEEEEEPRPRSTSKKAAKRKRAFIKGSDESGDEYRPNSHGTEDDDESVSSGVEEVESDPPTEDDGEHDSITVQCTPSRKNVKMPNKSSLKTPKTSQSVRTPSSSLRTPKTPATPLVPSTPSTPYPSTPALFSGGGAGGRGDATSFKHEALNWLREENRRDAHGNRPQDPDYNPRTIQVPRDYLKGLTPAMRQWWEVKRENFDTVLFFKVGKFYEMYHMDAFTGVQELGLTLMKGETAHSGFPEKCFGRFADMLVQKGYKVARVEQTETPQMMDERVKRTHGPTKFDKVVRREVCSIITKGTRTLGAFISGEMASSESNFLLAVNEKPVEGTPGAISVGVCFVDTCIGIFHLGQFVDDRECSRLRTLVAHYPPAQVLWPRGRLGPKVTSVIQHNCSGAIKDSLTPGSEFWDSTKTLKHLLESSYFVAEEKDGEEECEGKGGVFQWPEVLKSMLSEDDALGLTASRECEQAISALGACVWCLKVCLVDHEILSLKRFEVYHPVDAEGAGTHEDTPQYMTSRQHMVLDGITLANLDVTDLGGGLEGTLLSQVDHTVTPFGKRLLKQWLCTPLCAVEAINDRLDAIDDLMSSALQVGEAKEVLKGLPDLERLLRKIHTMGSKVRSSDHPDSRAILYEETLYSKKKIHDFLSVLTGFERCMDIVEVFSSCVNGFKSSTLKSAVSWEAVGGHFPDVTEKLKYFKTAFDHEKAKKDGVIQPSEGVNKVYDKAKRDMKNITKELDEYLERQRKRLGCRTITYWGSGRNRFQLEVPMSALSRHTPDDYELKSQRKGFRRYWTSEIEDLLARMVEAEERRDAALKDTMRTIFHSFDSHFSSWDSAVQCLSVLDVLISLATYSCSADGVMCRPEFKVSQQPFLDIINGRHPCIVHTFSGDDFIPNDVSVGEKEDGGSCASCIVVTGPNMGGKSTLLRQTGLIVVQAQLGCYVPAESCSLSPVDRVFTRLGATDRIMSGESTFFVELSETATILQHATRHSLVLLDELGRGTATYDGTAIACAVVRELAESVQCRTLFSTHYHSLVEEFAGNARIGMGHMACMVENEGVDGEEEALEETITFLYKFTDGPCPKSYGFNAAKLAGLPREVITQGRKKANEFEDTTKRNKLFRLIFGPRGCSLDEARRLQGDITSTDVVL